MEMTRTGHKLQFITITYFIMLSLILGYIVELNQLEVGIIPGIIIAQYFMVGLMVLLYFFRTKSKPTSTLMMNKIKALDILICIGIGFTVMPPLLGLINVLSQFFVTNQVTMAIAETLKYPFLLTLFLTAVTPAVLEEFLTRSLIISNYKKHSVLIVCLMSGAFFGFVHMNINQFLYAFVMGLIMCYVVMITKSVYSSIIIHFTINATSIVTLYVMDATLRLFDDSGVLMEQMMTESANITSEQQLISVLVSIIMTLVFTPFAGLLIYALLNRHGKVFRGSLKTRADLFMLDKSDAEDDNNDNLESKKKQCHQKKRL